MKFFIKTLTAALAIATSQVNATGVAFSAESGQVIIDSTPIVQANVDDFSLTILGFYVGNAQFNAFTSEEAFGASARGDIDSTALQGIVNTLNTYSSSTYNTFQLTPTGFVDQFGLLNTVVDPNNPFESGAAGNHPVMIILEGNSTLGSLSVGDSIGVVSTTSQTLDLGDFTVGFTTGSGLWDTTLVGTAGSINLSSVVVPEPSAYGLIAGLFGLAWVMVRRRT